MSSKHHLSNPLSVVQLGLTRNRRKSLFAEKYFGEFKGVLNEVLNVDSKLNEKQAELYIESLIKSAEEIERKDAFSKARLFNETIYEISEEKVLGQLIGSVRQLIENIEYRPVIERHLAIDSLKSLACELIEMLWDKAYNKKKKLLVNDIVRDVKKKLRLRTAATQVEDIDLYQVKIDANKVKKFTEIVKFLQKETVIFEENLQGFKVVGKRRAFNGAGEIKAVSGQRVAFSDAFSRYNDPYAYLVVLRENDALVPSEFYKYFTKIEYEILNKEGVPVSGGERSEFRLLQEIQDAQNFDLLLIDEPESSFDNIFLKGEVNSLLKEISNTMPVVVVTHNSTVGASIGADYIIYTSKEFKGRKPVYKRYSGHPSDIHLVSHDGEIIKNFEVTMNSLEAGETTYAERRQGYESIKD